MATPFSFSSLPRVATMAASSLLTVVIYITSTTATGGAGWQRFPGRGLLTGLPAASLPCATAPF